MTFSWPWALLGLLVIPLLLGIWWLLRRRRRRNAVRVTSLSLVRAAVPGRTRWRRRIPVILLVAALAVLGIGAARPQATVAVPSSSSTILLALDVSGSMCSTDVDPNRITAAENAASTFIKSQAGGPRIGLVAFAGTAGELVPPTTDTQKLLDALKGLQTSRGTAIGQAILTSIDAIAKVDPAVPPTGADVKKGGVPKQGGYASDAIVVLTDGANTQGVSPATAAQQAAERKVRVFTIGFGTTNPAPLVCDPGQAGDFGGGPGGGGGFGGFGNFGGQSPLVADDTTLKQIAHTTGGTFYRAQNAGQLQAALATLPHAFTLVHKQLDLSAWFAVAGGILAAAALALSLWWSRIRRQAAAGAPPRSRGP
jgi:Ca-activated chloride channel homolog